MSIPCTTIAPANLNDQQHMDHLGASSHTTTTQLARLLGYYQPSHQGLTDIHRSKLLSAMPPRHNRRPPTTDWSAKYHDNTSKEVNDAQGHHCCLTGRSNIAFACACPPPERAKQIASCCSLSSGPCPPERILVMPRMWVE